MKIETVGEVDIIRCINPSVDLGSYGSRDCEYIELGIQSVLIRYNVI